VPLLLLLLGRTEQEKKSRNEGRREGCREGKKEGRKEDVGRQSV
jgi:hypothetical protein